jgi:serine/threonine protein kinase/tetratricopeptide (TPR) repeat protein
MLCTYCGADTPPVLDRCVVCHTPYPPGFADPTVAPTDADLDVDETRLGTRAEDVPARPGISIPNVDGVPVLQPGQTFASRYTIIRLLGAGGMAAVYQAWDETLATAVALKLIRIDPAMEPADIRQLEERFKRELKLARQVTHPNVVRIHDLGEVGRTLYLTMAYVPGADLATVLQRDGRLPIGRVLALARQIVSGLGAAHKAGVVHRDLKPANIMVGANDEALLTDFGIARSTTGEQTMLPDVGIGRANARADMSLHTMPGAIMGTLEYMAPEQTRGEPADERTDIYAVGLILYELVAGGRPRVSREGGLAALVERLQKGPPPLREAVPDVPDGVDAIVAKCLKPDPADRYANADDLLADLERLDAEGHPLPLPRKVERWKVVSAAAAISALLIAGTWWAASNRVPPIPLTDRPAVPILIVDFENRAQEPAFDGVLEQALSIGMEGAPFITAYPRKDAAALVRNLKLGDKLDENTGRLVANREGIGIILAGSIERADDGYRIRVRALNPENPKEPIVAADARAPDKVSVLGAVGKIAERVRKGLGDTTPSAKQQAETFTAASLDAVREYTIAQELSANQKDEEAIRHYEAALAHDSEFGRAYAGRAMSLHYLGRREAAAEAWEEALRRLDRMTEREKLRTTGLYYAGPARHYQKAIEEYEQLVLKYPADSAAHNNLAVAQFSTLNFSKALEHGQRAIEIYPRSFKYRANLALYAMYAGDFKKAAETAQKLVEEDATFETSYLPLAMEALASGDAARAQSVYEQAAKHGDAGASLAAIGIADVALYQGRIKEAVAGLPPAIERDVVQKNAFGATAKLLALADAHAAQRQFAAMHGALARARTLGEDDNVLVTTARLAISSGRTNQAKAIAAELGNRLPPQSRAYGKLIEAEIAMAAKDYVPAIDSLAAAQKLANLWLVRYALGHAYFQRGDHLAALSEFEECQRRRGEATAIFLDDLPTFRYYAPLPYWLGRAREARGLDPRTQYGEFLKIRSGAPHDPLVVDARQRLTAAGQPTR